MHKSAGGIEESPLSILLRSGNVDMIAPWVSMLVDDGHVRQEHLNKFRKINRTIPAHIAMLDAHLARRQILDIAGADHAPPKGVMRRPAHEIWVSWPPGPRPSSAAMCKL